MAGAADRKVAGALNSVRLDMGPDGVQDFGAKALGLGFANTRNRFKLVQRHRVGRRHFVERSLRKQRIRRNAARPCQLAVQILKRRVELRVEGSGLSGGTCGCRSGVILVKGAVGKGRKARLAVKQVGTGGGHRQDSVALEVLVQKSRQHQLPHKIVPVSGGMGRPCSPSTEASSAQRLEN